MDFGKVLTRSWEIIWKHKVLWIFGILASCGSRGFSFGGNFNYQMNSRDVNNLPPAMQRFMIQVQHWFERTPPDQILLYVLLFIAAVLVIALIFWLIGIYGRTSLIYGTLQADAGKKVNFRSVWNGGFSFFGRAVGLNTILSLIPIAVGILIAAIAALLAIATFGIGLFCLIPLICLLIPIFLLYAVYVEMANVALVSEDIGAVDSIRRGWETFRSNLGNLIIMGLILFVGALLISVIIAIPFILVSIPLVIGFMSSTGQDLTRYIIIFVILAVLATPFYLLFNGILQSYLQSAWALACQQLTGTKKAAVRAQK